MVTANRYLTGLNQKGSASSTEDRAEGPSERLKVRNEPWSSFNSWNDGKLPPPQTQYDTTFHIIADLITRCCIHTSFIKQIPFDIMTVKHQKGVSWIYETHFFFHCLLYRCCYNVQCPVPNLSDSLCTTLHKDCIIPSYSDFFHYSCFRCDMLLCIRNRFVIPIPQMVCLIT
jgi:hypothetical protein